MSTGAKVASGALMGELAQAAGRAGNLGCSAEVFGPTCGASDCPGSPRSLPPSAKVSPWARGEQGAAPLQLWTERAVLAAVAPAWPRVGGGARCFLPPPGSSPSSGLSRAARGRHGSLRCSQRFFASSYVCSAAPPASSVDGRLLCLRQRRAGRAHTAPRVNTEQLRAS